jgi:hypothetical protein
VGRLNWGTRIELKKIKSKLKIEIMEGLQFWLKSKNIFYGNEWSMYINKEKDKMVGKGLSSKDLRR